NKNDNYISQSISHTNKSEKDLELMHVDDNCLNMELEIIAEGRNNNSSNKYITESADSFNESEESESEMNESKVANSSSHKKRSNASWVREYFDKKQPTKEWKKIGQCKVLVPDNKGAKSKRKCGVLIHTQGLTTNFASHLLTHGLVKPKSNTKKNDSQSKIDIIFKKTTTNTTNRKEAIHQALQTIEAVRDLVQKHTNQVRVHNKQIDINMNNKLLNLMFGNQEQSEHNE
ncbi:17993_t:CDS:2, partial [Gigaspora margarita]